MAHVEPADAEKNEDAHKHQARLPHADDGEPLDVKPDGCGGDEACPKPSTDIGHRDGQRSHHQCRDNPQQKVIPLPPARCDRCLAFGHDPVFTAKPPNRRSRLAYSAMAPSSAALSKSGQWTGTKTSSL